MQDVSPVQPWVALSIRQPWAALLLAGVKTLEVRTWSTLRRGPVLIHAGRVPDLRSEAWDWVTTPELRLAAEARGGIVGWGNLIDCITYRDAARFAADVPRHLNAPEWFRPPKLYAFAFAQMQPLPFRPYLGSTSFFRVEGVEGLPTVASE